MLLQICKHTVPFLQNKTLCFTFKYICVYVIYTCVYYIHIYYMCMDRIDIKFLGKFISLLLLCDSDIKIVYL